MVRSQQDTTALPASRPFAGGQAGYDYFADEQHYRSLADRVLAGLRQGGRIVLVTGDPPVNLSSLAAALTEATAGKHTVLAITCGGEFNEQELRRAAGPSPLIMFHQAERLLDGQLAKLCSYLASGATAPSACSWACLAWSLGSKSSSRACSKTGVRSASTFTSSAAMRSMSLFAASFIRATRAAASPWMRSIGLPISQAAIRRKSTGCRD
jgi:hypothetical protein